MRHLTVSETKTAETVFSNSLYKNEHPGWFDLLQVSENSGSVFLDTDNGRSVLLAFQPISQSLTWLHTFYADSDPLNYDLAEAARNCGLDRNCAVFTISSHEWYSALLRKNLFRKCDEIIQLETDRISLPRQIDHYEVLPFEEKDIKPAFTKCESSFPLLWRLHQREFTSAWESASYKRLIRSGNTCAGFILAEVSENNCHITRLASAREMQHKGIASALVRWMILDCGNGEISSFSVNTNRNNTDALTFYSSLNLKQTGKTYPVCFRYI